MRFTSQTSRHHLETLDQFGPDPVHPYKSAVQFITRDDTGGIYSTDLPPQRTRGRHPLLFKDRVIQLTAHQAERLCDHLDRTLQELTERDDTDDTIRQKYAVMIAAVPLVD